MRTSLLLQNTLIFFPLSVVTDGICCEIMKEEEIIQCNEAFCLTDAEQYLSSQLVFFRPETGF